MGAIAEAFVSYAQPLIDQTDGSFEQMNKAFAVGRACYNLAMMAEDHRERALDSLQSTLEMDDREFAAFRRDIVLPMIRRHEEMFPLLHRRSSAGPEQTKSWLANTFFGSEPEPSYRAEEQKAVREVAYPGTRPYAPCPCNSGRKYKFCCGRRGR